MSDALHLGVTGIEAVLGDHICGLYSNQLQRDQIMLPFLEAGLAAGDKCICVVDGTDPKEVVAALGTHAQTAKFVANKQLEVIRAPDMYLRSGGFSADEVISTWKAAMSDVMYDGRFDVVRAVETWSRRDVVPDMAELMTLESEMNRFLPLFPQIVVCLYDIDRFGSGNFDWTHKAFHTNEWVILAARHLFDDMFLAADAIDSAIQLNFVFETGFSNLQFMTMAAMADRAHHHLFEKTLASIQTDEARHAQIGHPVMRTLLANGSRERAQYLVDKMWWRCWRLFLALTGTAMEYLTPLDARTRSFKEFMTEWVTEQFIRNLAEFDLEKPWFWDLFIEGLDYAHHSFQLGLYTYRTTLWFDVATPNEAEREWLNAKYPDWEATYGPLWDRLERNWQAGGESNTLSYGLPALCNLRQLPAVFIRPGRNTACTLDLGGRRYLFCSEPCRWIFGQESARFADHKSVVDRIVVGEAPGKLTDLHKWMGLEAPVETGKDLRRGLDPWRLNPIPSV